MRHITGDSTSRSTRLYIHLINIGLGYRGCRADTRVSMQQRAKRRRITGTKEIAEMSIFILKSSLYILATITEIIPTGYSFLSFAKSAE